MEEIDIVLTWVDDTDENWRKEKDLYSKQTSVDKTKEKITNSKKNYRDWKLLVYWFRSVEKYAPWVRKVHFVTYGHIPKWLNLDHPKLNIVKHSEILPKEALPTFNSRAIEVNLHRINGLAERFIYFNDDTFILKKIEVEDFFLDSMPRDAAILSPIIPSRTGTASVQMNDISIVNEYFPKKYVLKHSKVWSTKYGFNLVRTLLAYPYSSVLGYFEPHLPNAFLKSSFEELWFEEFDVLNQTTSSKFKQNENVNQWIFRYWQLSKGTFYPRSLNIGKYFEMKRDTEQIIKNIKKPRYKLVCLNDEYTITEQEFYTLRERMIQVFDNKFSEKSDFEL